MQCLVCCIWYLYIMFDILHLFKLQRKRQYQILVEKVNKNSIIILASAYINITCVMIIKVASVLFDTIFFF